MITSLVLVHDVVIEQRLYGADESGSLSRVGNELRSIGSGK